MRPTDWAFLQALAVHLVVLIGSVVLFGILCRHFYWSCVELVPPDWDEDVAAITICAATLAVAQWAGRRSLHLLCRGPDEFYYEEELY